MSLDARIAVVDLNSIELENTDFIITAGRADEKILLSIQQAGLLNPPLLAAVPGKDTYRIVCGFLRLQALRKLGGRDVPARIAEGQASDRKLLETALWDNLGHRRFNILEQAGAVARLAKWVPQEEILHDWLPRIGSQPMAKAFDSLLRIDALEQELKQALLSGAVSDHSAASLALLARDDRLALCGLFAAVHPSASKQAEIMETLVDLACRDNRPIHELLAEAWITAILAESKTTVSQKCEQVRSQLHRRRFPRLAGKEDQFSAFAKRLSRAPGMRIVPPQSFEGDTYRIEISFSRTGALDKAAGALQDLAADEQLQKLLEDSP